MPGAVASQDTRVDPTITSVTPSVVKAPIDFSSAFRGYWWDFESKTHYGEEQSRADWVNPRIVDGWFIGNAPTSTASSPTIRLSNLKAPNAIPSPEEHVDTPFDPSYRYLTVYMCVSKATSAMIFYHRDGSFADGDYGGTNFKKIPAGCGLHQWDLATDRNANVGRLGWSRGGFTALRIRPITTPGTNVRMNFATLAEKRRTGRVTIRWDDAEDPVTLFISPNSNGSARARIAANRTGGIFRYKLHNLAPGTYYIVSLEGRSRFRVGHSFTVDAPPQGRLVAPSYLSGKDYATVVVGDAWDMKNAADVANTRNLASKSFTAGKFVGTSISGNGDPGVFLNVSDETPIDPADYFYLTYRMRVLRLDQLNEGAVVRWAYFIAPSTSDVTQDVREYDSWQTVTFDMRTIDLEPNENNEAGGWLGDPIDRLRLDPHENRLGITFHIDWVKLTGHTMANRNFLIRYAASDDTGDPTVRFYYGTDDSVAGRTRVLCRRNSPAGTCRWITTDIPEGDYLIQMVVLDDIGNRKTIVSEVPVLIRH